MHRNRLKAKQRFQAKMYDTQAKEKALKTKYVQNTNRHFALWHRNIL